MYQDWMENIPVIGDIEIKEGKAMNEKEKKAIEDLKELSHYCSIRMLDLEDKNSDIWARFVVDMQIIKNLIEKQDKIINAMAKYIADIDITENMCPTCKYRNTECTMQECVESIIEYFEEKVRKENGNA